MFSQLLPEREWYNCKKHFDLLNITAYVIWWKWQVSSVDDTHNRSCRHSLHTTARESLQIAGRTDLLKPHLACAYSARTRRENKDTSLKDYTVWWTKMCVETKLSEDMLAISGHWKRIWYTAPIDCWKHIDGTHIDGCWSHRELNYSTEQSAETLAAGTGQLKRWQKILSA